MKFPLRIGIGTKICLLTSLLIVTTFFLTWPSIAELGSRVLILHELIDNDDDTHLAARSIRSSIEALREDTLDLASRAGKAADAGESRAQIDRLLVRFLDENWIPRRGSAYRQDASYRRACYLPGDGGDLPPRWVDSTRGAPEPEAGRPRAEQARESLREALALDPRQVRLSGIDRGRFEIRAVAPVYRAGAARPEGAILLDLDLKPKIDASVESPRTVAFVAGGDDTLLAWSHDIPLDGDRAWKLGDVRGLVKLPGEKSPDEHARGPNGPPALLEQERILLAPGVPFRYDPPSPMFMLAIDIEKPQAVADRVSSSFLEGLQKFLDDSAKGRDGPKIVASRGLAQDWPNYYPYAFVRSSDRARLEEIRGRLEAHPTLGARTRSRAIFDCGSFDVRLIKLPYDPGDRSHLLQLGVGVSRNELRSDFEKGARELRLVNFGILAGGVAITYLFSRILTGPLKRMTRAAEGLAEGDFSARLPTRARDEIGVLARTFEAMGAQVRARTEELRAAALRTRTILDMAAEGIITINTDGIIESFNRAAGRILGYPAEEVLGRHISALLPGHGGPVGSNELSELVARGQRDPGRVLGRVHVLTGRRKDGSEFPMEIAIGEVDLGDRRLFTSIVRDITERHQAEEALRAGEERLRRLNGELDRRVNERTAELERARAALELSNQQLCAARDATEAAMQAQVVFFDQVAHDLRTPLTNVIGYGQELRDQAVRLGRDDFVADLNLVVDQGRFLGELIDDLLNVSKAMNGKELTLKLAEFDLPSMLAARLPGIHYFASQNENRVELDCPADLGTMIADEVRVWRILMNLLTNACKFTEEGTIRVSARREAGPQGDRIVFRVADTGRGMAPDQVARLFNRFEQVHNHLAADGFGLGLSTCSLYCRAMGGEIRVESEIGRGSTFTVVLPAAVDRPRPAAPPRPAPRVATIAHAVDEVMRGHETDLVLIIDDDPSFGELMRRHLVAQGFQARLASDGEEGLRLAIQLRPAAILLDVVMPGIDGWAVLAALKTDATTAGIPIIMATMVDECARGVALGADDFATKPISRDRLAELLRKHLGGRRAERILVVEDDASARELLVRMLAEHGFEVGGAADGRIALESIAATRPDLVLIDLMLPNMDGFELVERIRREHSSREIPIIIVTGVEITPEARRRLQGQVAQILQKGRDGRDELFREVRTVVSELRQRSRNVPEAADA